MTKQKQVKKRKYVKKSSVILHKSETPDVFLLMNKEYEELKAKFDRKLKKIKDKLLEVRSSIRKHTSPNLYHKRSVFIRQYDKLNQQKKDIENCLWEKEFLVKYNQVLERLCLPKKKKNSPPCEEISGLEIKNKGGTNQVPAIAPSPEFFNPPPFEPPLPTTPQQLDICSNPRCNQQALIQIPKEGKIVCIQCGQFNRDLSSATNHLAYGEEIDVPAQHQYERSKNFTIFLQQFSADAKAIPDELLIDLIYDLRANPNRSQQELRCTPCKNWLKSHEKWKKYADSAFRICNMVNGIHNPKFTKAQIQEYKSDFETVELIFFQIQSSRRNNFLNSSFVMNKLTGLHGQTHNQAAFPLLRHKRTLFEQEVLWQLICEKTKWDYERSI